MGSVGVGGVQFGFAYESTGQVTSVTYANGVTTSYGYTDPYRRLAWIYTGNGTSALINVTYARDAAGKITGYNGGAGSGEVWTYSYDELDRLVYVVNGENPSLNQYLTWSANGNLTSKSNVGAYAYPAQGPNAVRPHAPVSVGGAAMGYDDNGNLVSGLGRSYFWDGENRPAWITVTLYSFPI